MSLGQSIGTGADQDYVLECRQFPLRDSVQQCRRAHQGHGFSVRHAIADRVFHEGFEKRAWDGPNLQDSKNGDIKLRPTTQEYEDAVPFYNSELPQDVGKSIRLKREVFEGEPHRIFAVGINQSELIPAASGQVPVDGLMRHVHLTRVAPIKLLMNILPPKALVGGLIILQV